MNIKYALNVCMHCAYAVLISMRSFTHAENLCPAAGALSKACDSALELNKRSVIVNGNNNINRNVPEDATALLAIGHF